MRLFLCVFLFFFLKKKGAVDLDAMDDVLCTLWCLKSTTKSNNSLQSMRIWKSAENLRLECDIVAVLFGTQPISALFGMLCLVVYSTEWEREEVRDFENPLT